MRIATDSKQKERQSQKYKRTVTGEKGIGRFAVRYLGEHLHLISTAFDTERGIMTTLEADFDWPLIDKEADIGAAKMPYTLVKSPDGVKSGTTLLVRKPRAENFKYILDKETSNAVLRMVNPFSALDSGKFRRVGDTKGKDPGFAVKLDGTQHAEGNIADAVLNSYSVRVIFSLQDNELYLRADVRNSDLKPFEIRKKIKNRIGSSCFGDVRSFIRRPGLFAGLDVDGREAYTWMADNSGVAVFDHGVRIYPYGDGHNDWLRQDSDRARNARQFRSEAMREIHGELSSLAVDNPMMHLPSKRQVIGAVFLESSGSGGTKGLVPSSDREGFLSNDAFDQLEDIGRTAVELIAWADFKEEQHLQEIATEKALAEAKKSFRAIVERVESSPTLAPSDKARIIADYRDLANQKDKAIEYSRRVQRNMEVMSMLGVVAGFMTHESRRIMRLLNSAVYCVEQAKKKLPELEQYYPDLVRSEKEFSDHVEYASMFIDSLQGGLQPASFYVKDQLEDIVSRFGGFATNRGIRVGVEVEDDCKSPNLPVAAYSGLALNLYTNALKAVIGGEAASSQPEVVFRAWNDRDRHYLQVVDNGVGIPKDIQDRIWDPLFTTTSNTRNPLGSGMGLGLSLVKSLVESLGGKIELLDPPPRFSTCFQIAFKIEK